MNANELRIGNCVYEYGWWYQIESGHDIDLMSERFEPIPLTPEILEKCGFEGNKERDTFEISFATKLPNLIIRIDAVNDMWYGNTYLPNSPNYLHQLQNLYFALTGEELEIKL